MSSSREDILNQVRAALGQRSVDAASVRSAALALLADPDATRPEPGTGSLADRFIAKVTSPRVAATVMRLSSMAAVPAAVRDYLQASGLPLSIALQPNQVLRALDWSGFEVHEKVAAKEPVAVGIARWGIAETGSLVFHSGPDLAVLGNFLPLHHLVVLPADKLLPYLDDYAALAAGQPMPRNLNLITGASGTTDIEGSLVLGAHGPRYLHVLVVEA
jgi:L-lactate dehydrogenase complex protein LldG